MTTRSRTENLLVWARCYVGPGAAYRVRISDAYRRTRLVQTGQGPGGTCRYPKKVIRRNKNFPAVGAGPRAWAMFFSSEILTNKGPLAAVWCVRAVANLPARVLPTGPSAWAGSRCRAVRLAAHSSTKMNKKMVSVRPADHIPLPYFVAACAQRQPIVCRVAMSSSLGTSDGVRRASLELAISVRLCAARPSRTRQRRWR